MHTQSEKQRGLNFSHVYLLIFQKKTLATEAMVQTIVLILFLCRLGMNEGREFLSPDNNILLS